MDDPHTTRPHILFLFSNTGGGDRSATEAIIEALHIEDNGRNHAPPGLGSGIKRTQ